MVSTTTLDKSRSPDASLKFEATDVTGTQRIPLTVIPSLLAETVAQSVASLMSLPENVTYALRDNSNTAYLDDRRPIGEQIAPGASVTLTPKTHLG